ncbi:hypothetical protein A3F27_00025 [Candidatus Kaiserbacteria bacterium RIFCSPHIGHO2_12_FULL_53_13]|uniref:DoxX family protein n=1 Tax=Candidatus Kaiserbacteria bacterium RIFCSPHIGHO2_12_FULL_53_13 TaxID=1798502 RepID=A0A1F6EC43_9BACT|nr:MAG: hypothetical protein A3F27_00025 [Candidatus Kaiserbacteria bacterium RIFCSPHIGHO2_12_FULL_53_13]OGG74280.1 MAG: hypothetical protein A3A37_03090 [Candidatus Kaiserbacteria bacterium RIFCSPLOWO2_01_FULL_52_36]
MFSLLKLSWASQCPDSAPLLLRLAAGAIFLVHGWQKLTMGVAGVAGFLGQLGFPAPEFFAVILIAVEVAGGAALILGVLTRFAAALSSIVALVALLTVHLSKGFFVNEGGYEFIALILAASLALLITGAGKYSLDRTLKLD